MVNVLFDHNMPPMIAKALDILIQKDGHRAYPLRDKFPKNISDINLYKELGKQNDWIVISKDTKNAKRKAEKSAILKSGVLAFYLKPSVQKQKVHEQAATILWQWDKIVAQRRLNSSGLYLIPINKGSGFKPL